MMKKSDIGVLYHFSDLHKLFIGQVTIPHSLDYILLSLQFKLNLSMIFMSDWNN